MIGDVLKRMRIIYGYKASEMSSELGIFQKLKITKSNHLWTSPKICGYLRYPIVLFDITF